MMSTKNRGELTSDFSWVSERLLQNARDSSSRDLSMRERIGNSGLILKLWERLPDIMESGPESHKVFRFQRVICRSQCFRIKRVAITLKHGFPYRQSHIGGV